MASHTLIEKISQEFLKEGNIVEIGSCREGYHISSTYYYNKLAQKHNTQFYSIDFSLSIIKEAKKYIGDNAICGDGVKELSSLDIPISLLYLDNFDIIVSPTHRVGLEKRIKKAGDDYKKYGYNIEPTNTTASQVHLEQTKIGITKLTPQGAIIYDDTWEENQTWYGKGAASVPYLLSEGFVIKGRHNRGVILQKNN